MNNYKKFIFFFLLKIREEPGPGQYDANDKHRNKEPSYSIGKEQREDDLKIKKPI